MDRWDVTDKRTVKTKDIEIMDRRDVTEKRGIYRTVKTKDNRNNGQEGCNGEKRDIQDSKDERQ